MARREKMSQLLTLSFHLLLVLPCCVYGLEIDILESFDLNNRAGVEKSVSFASYPIYTFGVSKDNYIARKPVTKEFLDLLSQHDQFIISLYVKPDPLNRGTLFWIQDKNTAQTLFGLWLRAGKRSKFSMPHFSNRKTQHVTFHDIGDLSDHVWHYLVVHVHPSFGLTRKVDLYVNCKKVGSMLSSFNYQNAHGGNYEMRLGQRGVRHFVIARWRGSITEFAITVNRDINRFVKSEKCVIGQREDAVKQLVANSPGINQGASFAAAKTGVINSRQLGTLLELVKNGKHDDNLVREILTIVKDVREIQSNQVGELKTLRQILESLTSRRIDPPRGNLLEVDTSNASNATTSTIQACDAKPCFPFVKCFNIKLKPGFQCGACPPGLTGDGINCTDIDECKHNPCSPLTNCMNRNPGYVCGDCPSGYRGRSTVGLGVKHALSKKQVCEDIDECKERQHKCDPLTKCINLQGGYKCGPCKTGYAKNSVGKCRKVKMCSGKPGSSSNPCSMYAQCIERDGSAICKCRIGFTGNGYLCSLDTDMDDFPDSKLNCTESTCAKDNCPNVPNSGQEDLDKDGVGDACDTDKDGDGIYNVQDKCIDLNSQSQLDTDRDGKGDACDNCMFVYNPQQMDMDSDGIGDVCDSDVDGDGISNTLDNCPFVKNGDQSDKDKDGHGDACDNCPDISNTAQRDSDQNGYGDACDDQIDSDKDGILDRYDNCPLLANAAQIDTDGDGKGDRCDPDDDDDGIADSSDNCPLIKNTNQQDVNGNSVGDVCEDDSDGDKVIHGDTCPFNKDISATNFTENKEILLSKLDKKSQKFPEWKIRNQGKEVLQLKNSVPSLLIGDAVYEGVDFTGTMFVQTANDDDLIGFVFAYQGPRRFYLVSWKQHGQKYWRSRNGHDTSAKAGVEIKMVNSKTGPGSDMRSALWHSGDYKQQTKIIWQDKKERGWKDFVPYYFSLQHRPIYGLIRLQIYEQSNLLVDTGYIVNTEIKGGKVGLYSFSQEKVVWSKLSIKCNDDIPADILRLARRT